ncbi:MAG: hypothetical protein Q8M16_15145 [Pirellulaceae bacterium]|nr:hypothetical protein [Pirellulaceae bacterium]
MKSEMLVAESNEADVPSRAVASGNSRRGNRANVSNETGELIAGSTTSGANKAIRSERGGWIRMDLTRYLEPLFIYQRTIWKTLILAGLACWVALLVWPRTYVSEGKFQLLVGRESVGLDPSSTTTQTLLMQKTVEEDINSALEVLGSRDVAEHVVREIGAEAILSGYLANGEGESSRLSKWIGGLKSMAGDAATSLITLTGIRDPISDEERAVLWLQQHVSVHAPKKSSTMIIGAEAKSAELAQAIVNSYTKHFIDRHVNVSTTEGSQQFFDEQAANAEATLNSAMGRRSDLLRSHKMVSAGSRFGSLTAQQSAIESTIISTEAQIRQSESELIDLSERSDGLELETVAGTQIAPDGTISGMRLSLHTLELEEQSLAPKYAASHWRIVQIKERVASAREALAKLEQASESFSMAPNPLRLKLEEDILRTKSRIVGLQSLLEESQLQLSVKQQEINDLLELEVQLEKLDREIEVAKKNLVGLREKQEQARVVENLRAKRISSVGIAQSATLVHKPASPNKLLIIVGFGALGVGLCIALIGMKEFSRTGFRHPDELERFSGYPVLADVARVPDLVNASVKQPDLLTSRYRSVRSACEIIQSEMVLTDNGSVERDMAGLKLGVVGIHDGAGASLMAMMLATLHNENGFARTILLDVDSKNGTIAQAFNVPKQTRVIRLYSIQTSGGPVELETDTGEGPALHRETDAESSRPTAVQGERTAIANLQTAAAESEFVVVDFPPMSRPASALGVFSQVDQVLLIVQAEQSSAESVSRSIRQIERAGGNIVGLVLNQTRSHVPSWIRKIIS